MLPFPGSAEPILAVKATPASGMAYAHLLATDRPHDTASAYRFNRFETGRMIDEKGMGNQPGLH